MTYPGVLLLLLVSVRLSPGKSTFITTEKNSLNMTMTMTPVEIMLTTKKEPEKTQTMAYFSLEPTAPTVSPALEKTPDWAEQTSVSTSLKLFMEMKHLQEPTLHLPEKSQTTPSLSPEPASSTISPAQITTPDWAEESISTSVKLSLEVEDLQPVASTLISTPDWTTTTSLNLSLTETLSVPEENSPPSSRGLNDITPTHEPTLASKPQLQSTLLRSFQHPAIQQAFLQPRSIKPSVQLQLKSVTMPFYRSVQQGQYCGDKEVVKGGTIQWPEERSSGSVLKYICPVGTYAYPVNWRVCVRGRWTLLRNAYGDSATVVTCKPVTCVSPRAPEFGALTPHQRVFGWNDTIHFSCYSGFVLLGSAQSTCQVNGRWSGKLPVCDRKDNFCSNPGVPFGGSRSGDFFDEGSVVKYTCDSRLVLRGSSERKCLSSGVWSGEEPQCQSRYTFDNVEDLTKEIQMVRSQIFKSGEFSSLATSLIIKRQVTVQSSRQFNSSWGVHWLTTILKCGLYQMDQST
ncbi:seizure 6-like protein 2 [Polyodon spathula]|uniref:seizure 6-like protein 2 n=1 Tax=Polyodon spathula TaxID=7913 RepID=UPI001B7E6EC3|nr:seizure 6-like protein 2 [Polyodon spathula]